MMSTAFLIGYRTASEVAGRLCSFATVLLAVRLLPGEDFGLFSLAWAAGWMVAIGGDFGLQLHLTREVARSPLAAAGIFSHLLRLRLQLCGTLLLAASAGLFWLDWLQPAGACLLVILSQVFGSLLDFHNHLYRGLHRSDLESTLNLSSRVATLLLASVALLLWKSLPALAVALAAGNGLALLAAHHLASRLLLGNVPATPAFPPAPQPGAAISNLTTLRHVWPIGLGILLSALYFRIDLFFVEHWLGSEPVGQYNAVFRLVDALRLLPAAVMAVVFPDLCRPGRRRTLALSVLGLAGFSLAVAGGGLWQASRIVGLAYGENYLPAVPAFEILLLSLPLLFVNFVLTHQLLGLDQERSYALLCAAGLAVSLVLNRLLVPGLGIRGAAWACLIREGLLTTACLAILLFQSTPPLAAAEKPRAART